MNYNHKLIIN